MKRWEYKVVVWEVAIDLEETAGLEQCMNEYGEDGWELVSVASQIKSNSNTDFVVEDVYTSDTILYFKKKIE